MAASFQDLANEIAGATQVVTDADELQPGKPVHVQVIPGYAAGGGLDAFNLTINTLNSVLQSAVDKVDVSIRYQVLDGSGNPAAAGTWKAVPDIGGGTTDPPQVKFLLAPIFTNDSAPVQIRQYIIRITINVTVEGSPSSTPPIDVPVSLPGIPVPSIAMFAKHAGWVPFDSSGDGNHLVVFVPKTSTYPDIGGVLQAFDNLMTTVGQLKDVVNLAADVLPAIQLVATAVDAIPTVDFVQGSSDDLDNINDFDDDASCGLLIGYTGDASANPAVPAVSITLFSDSGFETDDNYSTWSAASSTPLPIGTWRLDNFSGVKYDHGGDDLNDNSGSFKWGGV